MFVFPGLLCRNGHPVNHKVLTLPGKLARDPPAIVKLFIHPCLYQIEKPVPVCSPILSPVEQG